LTSDYKQKVINVNFYVVVFYYCDQFSLDFMLRARGRSKPIKISLEEIWPCRRCF